MLMIDKKVYVKKSYSIHCKKGLRRKKLRKQQRQSCIVVLNRGKKAQIFI